MDEARLTELEAKYAWLERHLAAQDKAMFEMGEDLRRLRREIGELRGLLAKAGSPAPESEAPEPPPPHY